MGFGEKDHRHKVAISSSHIKSTYIKMIYESILTLITWLKFLHCKLILFSPFHAVLFGRKSLCASHI